MTDRELMQQALAALEANRHTHYYCEDSWYSCPKHEDGCANEAEGNECNCGADKDNAEIDYVTAAIKEALAQPEQEPVAIVVARQYEDGSHAGNHLEWRGRNEADDFSEGTTFYTTPPQRKPLTDEEIEREWQFLHDEEGNPPDHHDFARAIEAKLKERNHE